MAKGCINAVLVHATCDHVYFDSRVVQYSAPKMEGRGVPCLLPPPKLCKSFGFWQRGITTLFRCSTSPPSCHREGAWPESIAKLRSAPSLHQRSILRTTTVEYSDSPPTLFVVHGRAKPVLRGPNSTEPNLEKPHTGLNNFLRMLQKKYDC